VEKLRRFGEKSHAFIVRPVCFDCRITILEGSIRSSKTFSMMVKLLALCKYEVGGQRVISGKSKNTIYQNVLLDLFELIGRRNYSYNRQTGELMLFGVRWIVIGAMDEGSEKLIRGMTIGIAYSDETALMPRSFFLQLLARMSPEGARLYCTTNPDNPYHYLKREFMDNKELLAAGDIEVIHFTLDDNPNLSTKVRKLYERMYVGVFYLRFILGLWVVAEGAIYRDVWEKVHKYAVTPLGLRARFGHQKRCIAIDYGTTNPCVFLDIYDTGHGHYIDREYYWDSKLKMRSKTDKEYADDLEMFAAGRGAWAGDGSDEPFTIILDPSAASFRAELTSRGFYVRDADNEVIDGIRMTAALCNSGNVYLNERCENTDREMQTYAWNEKAAANGEEEPIKKNDHCPDAWRYYVKTEIPQWRLAE
jgi:PBSX family phage terminase large subunit